MALPLEQVVKQLEDSGIVAAGKLENFVPPKAHPRSVEELSQELVKSNLLTPFQAQHVNAGKVKSLILGGYTIINKIGAGGMGQVFKALHRKMDRTVAIKMLPPAMTKDAAALARFEREVRAAAKLFHPNIVPALDADQANGAHFLVMEYVDGKDLSALVKKNGPFPVGKAVNYVLQAARGLEFAHKKGVIHRDIKPANLLLDSDGVVKILDMGLARIEAAGDVAAQAELTGTGTIMGTVDYMAPEQGLSTKHADARADIYSLGCTLHYLLIGKATYGGETVAGKLLAHHHDAIPNLCQLRDDVPEQVQAVFRKMVAKKIEDRYQTMTEVVADLEKCQAAITAAASSSTSVWKAPATDQSSDMSIFMQHQKLARIDNRDDPFAAPEPEKKKPRRAKASGKSPPGKNTRLLIGAGAAGFLIVLVGVIVFLRNQKGDEVGRMELPDGTSVEVQASGKATPVTSAKAVASQASQPWNTPAFQAWVKATQALPAEKQIEAVSKKLMELNPGFDGKVWGGDGKDLPPKIERGFVTVFSFYSDTVTDISPVRVFEGLTDFRCLAQFSKGSRLNDLSPLQGLQLQRLQCDWTNVADLSPLTGMPLQDLRCRGTLVGDLTPLNDCKTLEMLFATQCTKVTSTQVANLQTALPHCKIEWPTQGQFVNNKLAYLDPAFQQWVKATQALPAEQQIEAVVKKLRELNPEFKGVENHRIENGVVTAFNPITDGLMDISPIRALPNLKSSTLYSNGKCQLSDLSPLKGMSLVDLRIGWCQVTDLSPLTDMPLSSLECLSSNFSDLSPLQGMRLTSLNCKGTKVFDLSPLKGMPLLGLNCAYTTVVDLSPLQGMKLDNLVCCNTSVSDLSPLNGMTLSSVSFTPQKITKGLDVIRQMKTLTKIGVYTETKDWLSPAEFWKKYDAGEFGKPAAPAKLAYLDPAFQAWVKAAQALPAEKQIEAVSKKLMELNPGFDGKVTPKIDNGLLTELTFITDNVTDLSPMRALASLKSLNCSVSNSGKGRLSDLSPLEGMKLASLYCHNTQVSDLSPLRAMPLTNLGCAGTQVSDLSPLTGMKLSLIMFEVTPVSNLSPLRGMPLTFLRCSTTQVTDLSPLNGMNLTDIAFTPKNITKGLDVIRQMKSLKTIGISGTFKDNLPPSEFWKKYDAGEFGKPVASARLAYLDPAFQTWMKTVQALPAEKQIEAVSKKLVELNPGYDGRLTGADGKASSKIENGVVTELAFFNVNVTDISPIRALAGLKVLSCGTTSGKGRLSDLSPLEGMKLASLTFHNTEVSDLSPLRAMPLTTLGFAGTQVSDLSPLTGMKLTTLMCEVTPVSELSPLRGMPLARLTCGSTQISDLAPLKGMPLGFLLCVRTKVSDLSPLEGMSLSSFGFTPKTITKGLDVIRHMKSLKMLGVDTINMFTPAEFWKKYDAGEFGKPTAPPKLAYLDPAFQAWVKATQALPAEQQIEAVSKKLTELNPGFDGKVMGIEGKGTPKIEKGVVTELGFVADNVVDISPVRALRGLKLLHCPGSGSEKGKLADLSPLEGMRLTEFYCPFTKVSDLSPLRGMPLKKLHFSSTQVSDLSPLQGMPLTGLWLLYTQVSDLSALKGMPLDMLRCNGTPVSDVSVLAYLPKLTALSVQGTKVTPAQVAALQKALPNCKIEWDDPAKPKTPEPAAAGSK